MHKKAFLTEKEHEGTQTRAKGGDSYKKKMVAFIDQIPKKRCMDAKHCINTHNTLECCKYAKDVTPKKAFSGKGAVQS